MHYGRQIQMLAPLNLLLAATVFLANFQVSVDAFLGVYLNSQLRSSLLKGPYRQPSILCGISGFRSWFESQFPDSVVPINQDSSSETFDHVLVDMNHVIHIIVRRSRSEEHAIRLLMSEIDSILRMAVPTKCLVLAIDGPPAAAKLATQRSRRYGTLLRTQWKIDHFDRLKISKAKRAKKLRNYNAELFSIRVSPGTEFQGVMENTLLYWAWQRLHAANNNTLRRGVKVFISTSFVPGEGEVKLLEWILQKPRKGESIALFGGDSDLLLEGLIVPPYWSHNIFVIQAEAARNYYSISLWETTRMLASWIPANAPAEQILQLRTDLVLLMILNGNDYIPKLQRSKGFSHVCKVYRRLVEDEYKTNERESMKRVVGIIDPDTLDFQSDFCAKFFKEISKEASPLPSERMPPSSMVSETRKYPLQMLNNLVEGSYIRGPKRFYTIDGEEVLEMKELPSQRNSEALVVRLTLGERGTEDFLQYEILREANESLKNIKQSLSLMALNDFFGTNVTSFQDQEYETLIEKSGTSTKGYSWELRNVAPGDCDAYLAGLVWNLQTYQDGICADYNYNYGKRMSPSSDELVSYFESAMSDRRSIGRRSLLGKSFSTPVSAGLSCLAALPSQVKKYVPEPYSSIPDSLVEAFYGESMDKGNNVFDMKKFESLCEEEIKKRTRKKPNGDDGIGKSSYERTNDLSERSWLILSENSTPLKKSFRPPQAPSKKFAKLFSNTRIRVSQASTITKPRSRSSWGEEPRSGIHDKNYSGDLDHSSFRDLLQDCNNDVLKLPYKLAYEKESSKKVKKKKVRRPVEINSVSNRSKDTVVDPFVKDSKISSFSSPAVNIDGQTALYILSELKKMRLVTKVEFEMKSPSESKFASKNPEKYENFQLIVVPRYDTKSKSMLKSIEVEEDRNIYQQSRQTIKHRLADLALRKLVGTKLNWTEISLGDLRTALQQRIGSTPELLHHEKKTSSAKKEGKNHQKKPKKPKKKKGEDIPLYNNKRQSALDCLYQLADAKLIGEIILHEIPACPPLPESLTLIISSHANTGNCLFDKTLTITEERKGLTRKLAKQRLASRALSKLTGPELEWYEVSSQHLRSYLVQKIERTGLRSDCQQ